MSLKQLQVWYERQQQPRCGFINILFDYCFVVLRAVSDRVCYIGLRQILTVGIPYRYALVARGKTSQGCARVGLVEHRQLIAPLNDTDVSQRAFI